MVPPPTIQEQIRALDRGDGVLDLEGWHRVRVRGSDAERWLNDLLTANVAEMSIGGSVRSLLLGPTGRIRADLIVHRREDDLLLLQMPGQPVGSDELLEPYLLSSDVALETIAEAPAVLPRPGPEWLVSDDAPDQATPVGASAFESWRIALGIVRFPIDLDADSLPAEAGLDEAPIIDRDKGCYLGQESVARVRNLGHPTRLVLAVRASRPVDPGEAVVAGGAEAGVVTSVDLETGGLLAIARIRWDARGSDLETAAGIPLTGR